MSEQFRCKPFNVDLDDLVALAGQVDQSSMRWFRWGAVAILLLVAVTVVLEQTAERPYLDWTLVGVGLFCALGTLVVSSVRFRGWLWLKFARRRPLHGPQTYALLSDGVQISAEKGKTEIPWTSLHHVTCEEGRLFLFLAERLAFVVPRRAFDSDAEFEAFAGEVQTQWKKLHRL